MHLGNLSQQHTMHVLLLSQTWQLRSRSSKKTVEQSHHRGASYQKRLPARISLYGYLASSSPSPH
jgi:hypothetical protein